MTTNERPRREEFRVLEKRLKTFEDWPETHHASTDMAHNGFYYSGYSDCVRCFWCGGGLRNWEAEDVPCIEHAVYFPHCKFLHEALGEDFVDVVTSMLHNGRKSLITMETVESELRKRKTHRDEAETAGMPMVTSRL